MHWKNGRSTVNDPDRVYFSLKLAARLYRKPLESLTPDERRRVNSVASRQQRIEARILATPQTAAVVLPEASIESGLMEVRSRYGNDDEYHADLERVGLNPVSLQQAVVRDMVVEAILEAVAASSTAVSETDTEIFWHRHKDRFRGADTRVLQHILVTINERLSGSEPSVAHLRIEAIRGRLVKEPQRFAEQALKHPACPTAIIGGLLGTVPRGQLYRELDAVAFALAEATLSEAVESRFGFHLIYCEAIDPERILSFAEARGSIRQYLEVQQRDSCQKAWIKDLRQRAQADKDS
ncbi:MAG: nitrogen fixation protein NifM [Candidatus Accumulibacter sp.]|uniref:nitrogen fixation protein NifM n=1 Tax=Accumulibacter sp. TaxID=2053492 RepID=UPI0025FAEE09|nr:nitrogen fixation protein NifM [Accumulibacter sp.]MCM8597497.1 nitrogen fixation protein NifM [Accumulibacter sp.]MCM8661719.1 nitrogen fixation protein NifM [Accumulibacter sp.]